MFLTVPKWFPEVARSIKNTVKEDQGLDEKTQPREQKDFIGSANGRREPPAYTPVSKAAINMESIKMVLH